jgi:subtilase family serine protease
VTAVGGTSLLLDKRDKKITELGWETSLDFVDYSGTTAAYSDALPGDFVFGGGGGTSTVFKQPSYQRGVVPDALAKFGSHQKMRVVPDIAAVGDPYTGFYIGETVDGSFGISAIGGTSLASPVVAGIQAVASQHRLFPIGFANPLLYNINGRSFNDIVAQPALHYASVGASYLGTFDVGDTQTTTRGYDNTTGRGTPNGISFLLSELIYPFRL